MKYEIRQIEAWNGPDGWNYNDSWHICYMISNAENMGKAIKRQLANQGITFIPHKTETVFDGDFYEIINRKTKEPLFVAIPLY